MARRLKVVLRVGVAFVCQGVVWAGGSWGMVDETGTMRLPEKYEQIGEFRGDLAKSLCLPEFLPGVKGAKIRKWLKAEGSEVKGGEALAQVELTEPTLPVEAPVSGMLVKIGVPAGGAAIPGSPIGAVKILGHVDIFAKKQHDVMCPGYGPNPGSATVVRWLKEEGDAVVKGDRIAEIRPSEAMAAINSPGTGTLVKIEASEGAEVKVGQSVARMGIGRVPVKLGGEWFYVDERGSRIWSEHYDEVGAMQGGMAPVRIGENWGFVNEEGKMVGKLEYEATRRVFGGLAAVKMKNRWGYVAHQDVGLRNAIQPRFIQARDFSEGLAAVEESDDAPVGDETEPEVIEEESKKIEGPPAWGYIIPSGKLWLALEFSEAGDFCDGRAAVKPVRDGASWVLIDSKPDKTGHAKVRTSGTYAGLVLLGEKRAAWRSEAKWGLMDFQEKVLELKPGGERQDVLLAVGPFGDKRAPAKDESGKWGYLDPDGKWVIPAKFERAGVFRKGLAAVKESGGKWGYLKPDGSWAMEPRFTKARSFTDGLAAVSEKGEVEAGAELEMGGKWE